MVGGYYPTSLSETLELLKTKSNHMLVSGGTDIMVVRKSAQNMIFINKVPELKEIKASVETISIGSGCVYADLLHDERIPEILRTAMSQIAAPAIRSAGTIGGNICNASPAGDTLPVLYALSAVIVKASMKEDGTIAYAKVPIAEFILGIRKIALQPEEIVVSIEIDKAAYTKATKTYYQKVGARNAQAISKLSFVGLMKVENEKIADIRISFGSIGITVLRKMELEKEITGLTIQELAEKKNEIIAAYAAYIKPIDDQRSTAEYRKKVCLNLLADFLTL